MTDGLRFHDLGPLEIERDGVPVPVGGARLAAALSLLLIDAGRSVGADALTDAMWGGDVRRSPSTLDSHIWRLRKALEPGRARGAPSAVLTHDAAGYRLIAAPDAVDSVRFARLAAQARDLLGDGSAEQARDRAEEALGLWRGRPYPTVADEPWAAAAVARLLELHDQLRETLVEALLATGAPERALLELEPALAETPLRERLWALRLLAQYRLGRTDEALRTYREARRVLLDELGLEPGPELRALHARVLAEDPTLTGPPPPTVAPAAGEVHLPRRVATIIGREAEVAELTGLVTPASLVTLVGAAGCGKTRLAIEVARRVADRFPDGVWFVDLTAAVADAEAVLATVVSTLGVTEASERPGDALRAFLRGRHILLVLDNCEHVLDPVAELVDDWFREPGPLAVLATSREPLDLDGEQVCPVGPLPLPVDGDVTASPAVALLLDRLSAAGADPHDLGLLTHAVRIAAAVDGVPLALELAAARVRAFSLEEIAHQVTADPSSLARVGRGGSHHRTVRAAIEQSYALLPADEAAVHRAVSALPGPFTIAAAHAAAGGDRSRIGDGLARLVHRSLLVPLGPARPGGPSRFTQLATIRGHAAHAAVAEADELRRRRDRWIAGLTLTKPRLGHLQETAWFDALDDDLPTLRATLAHLLVDEPSAGGVAVAARLGPYWYFRSKTIEGRTWAERALHLEHRADPLPAALVRLTLAHCLAAGGRADLAAPHRTRAAALLDGTAEAVSPAVAEVHMLLAHSLFLAGDVQQAGEVTRQVRAAADATADAELRLLADTCAILGDGAAGRAPVADLAALHARAERLGNVHVALLAAGVAVLAAVREGDLPAGLAWSDRMIAHRLVLGTSDGPVAFELRAVVSALMGEHREAARLFAAARNQALRNGLRWPAVAQTPALLEQATGALPAAEAEQARAEGARLDLAGLVRESRTTRSASV